MERRGGGRGSPHGENSQQPGPIEQAAKSLGIPQEKLGNAAVRRFLGFYCQLERMQKQMGTEFVMAPKWFTKAEIDRELENQTAIGIAPDLAVEPKLEPSLAERYAAGEHLLRAAIHIFRDGFNGHEVNTEYLRRVGNSAFERFGMTLEYKRPEKPHGTHDHESQINVPDAMRQWANQQRNDNT